MKIGKTNIRKIKKHLKNGKKIKRNIKFLKKKIIKKNKPGITYLNGQNQKDLKIN
jgi:hypothetical protein